MATHAEPHSSLREVVRDAVLGAADGLTVPFALAAGLAGAAAGSRIVATAGLAEVAAGAIAMGLGGYLAARGDADHFEREERREAQEVADVPDEEAAEVAAVLASYGLQPSEIEPLVHSLRRRPRAFVDFMMRFELGLEKPERNRARRSAITIATAYVVGGMIPLAPYLLINDTSRALVTSIAATAVALFAFGFGKGTLVGRQPLRSALETLFIGSLAASVAFFIARLVGR